MSSKIAAVGIAGLVLVVSAGAALAAPRGKARGGVEALERRYYVALLRADQKAQAKAMFVEFLAETAPDRALAGARRLQWRADAAALLTVEQRKLAGGIAWFAKHMDAAARRAGLDKVLDGTNRAALADRVERLETASPEDRVTIGFEILDQAYEALMPELSKRLSLTDDQATKLRALFAKAKDDLKPVAVRLERAKSELRRKAIALLDAEQGAKFATFHENLRAKVLALLRGRA